MSSLNHCTLIGRLVKNPELKTTSANAKVTSFTLAVDNVAKAGGAKSTSFIPCNCWNKLAENVAKFTQKGSLIAVEGRLIQRSYEDKAGVRRNVVEVNAENVQFLERKNSDSSYDSDSSLDNSSEEETAKTHEGIDSTDDDLPY